MLDFHVGWQSFAITFREGFEALLVVFGLELFLTERAKQVASTYVKMSFAFRMSLLIGTSIALVFALPITAIALNEVRAVFYNDWIRLAMVATIAVFILTLCVTFENSATFPKSVVWEGRIKRANYSPWMIALAAGIIVYREGIETIMFMVGVIITSANTSPQEVGTGIALGIVLALSALALVYCGFRFARELVPVRAIMLFISALLFWLVMHFVGSTVKVMQSMNFLPKTEPSVDWTALFYANWEMLAVEALVGFVILVTMLVRHWRQSVRTLGNSGL